MFNCLPSAMLDNLPDDRVKPAWMGWPLKFSVNDKLLDEVCTPAFSQGGYGFFISTFKHSGHIVSFDNLPVGQL